MVDKFTSVDDWAGEVVDDDYCYHCSKWIEATHDDCCPICEQTLDYSDEFVSSTTAKVAVSDAPKVNTYTGDIWNRSKGYVWGGGNSWWNSGSSAYTGGVSSMWGSWGGNHANTDDAARMLKHKRHLDSLCKVVDPTVAHTLDWSSDARNYSDLKRGLIRIDGNLLRETEDNLDITAGLAIHEKLHLIHSKPLMKWERDYRYEKNLNGYEGELLHSIANSVEDEYIEKQLAKDNAGFVTYIEAVKKHFFDTRMEGKLNEAEGNEFMDLLNTLLAFIRWPQHLDAERRKKHAKHIQFFARALAKGLDSRENSFKCIEALYEYLKKVAEHMVKNGDDDMQEQIESKMKELKDAMGDELSDEEWDRIESKVTDDITSKERRTSPIIKLLREEIDKLRDLSEIADWSRAGDTLDEDLMKEIKDLEDSDYSEETIKDVNLIYKPNQKKITWRKAKSDEYSTERYNREAKEVRKITSQLKKKIDLYGNSQKHVIRNQKRGKIDKRMLHRIPVGRQDLFKCDIVQDDKPLDVCLLIDESGSMSYTRMDIARKAAISLKEALADNPKLNLWVHGHTADGDDNWHSDKGSTNLTEYWGPSMKDRPMAMGGMRARHENRDGTAIYASAMKVKKESQQPTSNKLMIVLSDGNPAAWNYGGYESYAHVKKVVTYLESQGWNIIQVGIGGIRPEIQAKMFSNHIFIQDMNELAGKIGKIIRRVIKV
jgi:Mg-chelatase subunit ChlD